MDNSASEAMKKAYERLPHHPISEAESQRHAYGADRALSATSSPAINSAGKP